MGVFVATPPPEQPPMDPPAAYQLLIDLPEKSSRFQVLTQGDRPETKVIQDPDANVTENEVRPGDLVRPDIRLKVVREAATTLAVKNALTWRYGEIRMALSKIEGDLDTIYNFSPLMLKEKVLPPVIDEGSEAWSLLDRTSATASEVTLEIVGPAQIVANPPNWRNYLIRKYEWDYTIPDALYPQTDRERQAWAQGVAQGWKNGVEYADHLFDQGMARLERDLLGVARYWVLAEMNVVNRVVIASGPGEVVNKDNILSVGQRMIRITRDSDYNKVDQWKPIVVSPTIKNP